MSYWRLFCLAAAASLAPLSVGATTIQPPGQLTSVEYQIGIVGAAKPVLAQRRAANEMPVPLSEFEGGSDPSTTVEGSYFVTATSVNKKQTLAEVSADVQLLAGGSIFPKFGRVNLGLSAMVTSQVEVISKRKVFPPNLMGVPVITTVKGAAKSNRVGVAEASVSIFPPVSQGWSAMSVEGSNGGDAEFDVTKTVNFPINASVTVVDFASGNFDQLFTVGVDSFAFNKVGSFFASADPSFEIDPSFPYADDFELVYSPGLDAPVAGPGAPESSTWAMMLVGFVGLWATRAIARRGKRPQLIPRRVPRESYVGDSWLSDGKPNPCSV